MKSKLKQLIEAALLDLKMPNVDVEIIPAKQNGDFASNIALKLASHLQTSPLEIAAKIKANIQANNLIQKIEIAKPGFINFFVASNQEAAIIAEILHQKSKYGSNNIGLNINIEFVSANPTGYLHIGHARNAAIGDTLARILKFAGNQVNKEYWLNDSGVQVNNLSEAVFLRYKELFGQKITLPENTYKGQDIIECALFLKDNIFQDKYQNSEFSAVKAIFKKHAMQYMLDHIKQDLDSINVKVDEYTSEKQVIADGFVDKALADLQNYIEKKDGSTWLKTTLKGDDKDRVLIKSDGTYTYFAPDIAGHKYKLKRNFDKIIDVFGKDHIGYGPRLKAAVQLLGLESDKFEILFMEMVSLLQNGKPLKMSKRAGTSFTIKDMLKVLDQDEVRYYLVSRTINAHIELDVDKIKSHDNDNPLFNIQYSHARASSLLAKSKQGSYQVAGQFQDKEKALVLQLAKFKELITTINHDYKVHKLPSFLLTVSRLFNSLYSNTKIINHQRETALLALTKATQIVLSNGLALLGIDAKQKL